jgi:uncharacterized phiE125 gp8 family phage protein
MPPLTAPFVVTVNEGDALEYELTLQDEAGLPLPLASLTTLRLWLTDEATGATINSRSNQDVKNANGGTFHPTSGLYTQILDPADSQIVGTMLRELQPEMHRALVEAVWTSGGVSRQKRWEVLIRVVNLGKAGSALAPLQDNALLSLEELRAALNIKHGGSEISGTESSEAALAEFINACSDALETQTGRRLKSRTYTDLYRRVWPDKVLAGAWLDLEWPITTLTAVEIDGTAQTTWMPGDAGHPDEKQVYVLEGTDPKHGRDRLHKTSGWCGGELVKLTYTAGYGPNGFPIPGDLKQAIVVLARDWYYLRDRQHQNVLSRSLQGEAVTYINDALPRQFRALVNSYRRWSA